MSLQERSVNDLTNNEDKENSTVLEPQNSFWKVMKLVFNMALIIIILYAGIEATNLINTSGRLSAPELLVIIARLLYILVGLLSVVTINSLKFPDFSNKVKPKE